MGWWSQRRELNFVPNWVKLGEEFSVKVASRATSSFWKPEKKIFRGVALQCLWITLHGWTSVIKIWFIFSWADIYRQLEDVTLLKPMKQINRSASFMASEVQDGRSKGNTTFVTVPLCVTAFVWQAILTNTHRFINKVFIKSTLIIWNWWGKKSDFLLLPLPEFLLSPKSDFEHY